MDLSKVSIGIKTLLRDEKLFCAIDGILTTMPEVQIVIADDGESSFKKEALYRDLRKRGDIVLELPFDSGFGRKSNAIAKAFERPYLLIGSDDFDFKPFYVRRGIMEMMHILDCTEIDIISGRVKGHGAYEFDLEDLGEKIIEHRVHVNPPEDSYLWFTRCDLSVNYSLIKRCVFEKVGWDDDTKIGGGEHGAFFVDVKRAGFKVAWCPGAEIAEQEGLDSRRYRELRGRSNDKSRPCFDKRGIKEYILGNGHVDYKA